MTVNVYQTATKFKKSQLNSNLNLFPSYSQTTVTVLRLRKV